MPMVSWPSRRKFLYGGTVGSAYKSVYNTTNGFDATTILSKFGAISTFSISFWFRLNPAVTYPSVGVTCHSNGKGFMLWINVQSGAGVIVSQWKTSAGGSTWLYPASYNIPNINALKNPCRIHHAALTLGDGFSRSYLDGEMITSVSGSSSFSATTSGYPVGIFYDGYSSSNSSGGSIIDDLSFWNITLDASTISTMYTQKKGLIGNETGLIDLYKFNNASSLGLSSSGTADMTPNLGGVITSARGLVF